MPSLMILIALIDPVSPLTLVFVTLTFDLSTSLIINKVFNIGVPIHILLESLLRLSVD